MPRKGGNGIKQPSRTEAQESAVAKAVAGTRRKWALPSHAMAVIAWNDADPVTRGPRPRHPRSADNPTSNARSLSIMACNRIGAAVVRAKSEDGPVSLA